MDDTHEMISLFHVQEEVCRVRIVGLVLRLSMANLAVRNDVQKQSETGSVAFVKLDIDAIVSGTCLETINRKCKFCSTKYCAETAVKRAAFVAFIVAGYRRFFMTYSNMTCRSCGCCCVFVFSPRNWTYKSYTYVSMR